MQEDVRSSLFSFKNKSDEPLWEQRKKPYHENGAHDHGSGHGHAHATFEPVSDCQVLIARGIGQPAYDHAVAHGLQVILTSEKSIGVALEAYRAGHLESDVQRVHPHRD